MTLISGSGIPGICRGFTRLKPVQVKGSTQISIEYDQVLPRLTGPVLEIESSFPSSAHVKNVRSLYSKGYIGYNAL
jgi:hypothetical protein